MTDLKISRAGRDGIEIVTVAGEIDVYTAHRLRERLLAVHADGRHRLVIDLRSAEYLDSTGLGVLCGALKRATAAGGWADLVAGAGDYCFPALRITGLVKVFRIHPDVETAVSARAS